jgi:hypothetical protein
MDARTTGQFSCHVWTGRRSEQRFLSLSICYGRKSFIQWVSLCIKKKKKKKTCILYRPIPDKRWFNTQSMVPAKLSDFTEWHDSWVHSENPYNLKEELLKYCTASKIVVFCGLVVLVFASVQWIIYKWILSYAQQPVPNSACLFSQ